MFDCPKRILRLPGFPTLYREKAEFLEVGRLRKFTVTKFVKSVRRFANIQQRWGL